MGSVNPYESPRAVQHGGFRVPPAWLPWWSAVAAFGAYFCMYGFRRPFTASTYVNAYVGDIDYKTLLVTSQVLGYTLSKFVGIRVIAEMTAARRAATLLGLIGGAEVSLVLFGLTPPPYGAAWLFINGMFLGMVFGLVLGFLEGRQVTEVLTAALCASFILADGVAKSIGAWLLSKDIAESWMPSLAGLLFGAPLLLFVWMLTCIPPPTAEDVVRRQQRVPMTRADRRALFLRYAGGLTPIILLYLMVTILRSIRADFAVEIWQSLGYKDDPSVFTRSEVPVLLAVTLATALSVLIRDNRRAFFAALGASLAGVAIVATATAALELEAISGFAFMVLVGSGIYLPYVAVHTTVFERLIAMTRERGNIGFLMYLADAFGYLGYVAVMFSHELLHSEGDILAFFTDACWAISAVSAVLILACWRYFATRPQISPGRT